MLSPLLEKILQALAAPEKSLCFADDQSTRKSLSIEYLTCSERSLLGTAAVAGNVVAQCKSLDDAICEVAGVVGSPWAVRVNAKRSESRRPCKSMGNGVSWTRGGKVVLSAIYQDSGLFYDGLESAQIDRRRGFVDINGSESLKRKK
jgi:hypothetical protein